MARIWLLDGNGEPEAFALIDDEDWERLSTRQWRLDASGYVFSSKGERLHRVVMNAPDALVVHHRNEDPTDNRKKNLQLMTSEEHRDLHREKRQKAP